MENVRNRALRIIFFSIRYGQALAISNMLSLVARREKLSKNYVNKRDDPNQILHHPTKTTQSNTHDYSLISGNKNKVDIRMTRTDRCQKSFLGVLDRNHRTLS